MNHKILIPRGSNLHNLICELYINSNRKCLLKSSKHKRDTRTLTLFESINELIASSYAKEFEWKEWYYGFEPCSLRDMLNHNVSLFVKQGKEEDKN